MLTSSGHAGALWALMTQQVTYCCSCASKISACCMALLHLACQFQVCQACHFQICQARVPAAHLSIARDIAQLVAKQLLVASLLQKTVYMQMCILLQVQVL